MRAQILLKLGCSFTCEAAGCNTIAHDVLPWHPVVLNSWGAAHELSAADLLSHFSHSSVAGYSTAGTHLLIHFSVHKVVPGLSWLVQSTVQENFASSFCFLILLWTCRVLLSSNAWTSSWIIWCSGRSLCQRTRRRLFTRVSTLA